MVFCPKCGKEVSKDDEQCEYCSHQLKKKKISYNTYQKEKNNSLDTATKVFMILACICDSSFFLIVLIWAIPMTIYAWNRLDSGEDISIGFKICYLIFVGKLAGILLLCNNN